MQKTEHYQLNQWDAADPIRREDFNADNAIIDAALAGKGNCSIVTGSYVGTGSYGADNPNTLTFDFVPTFVAVTGGGNAYILLMMRPFGNAIAHGVGSYSYFQHVAWEGNSVSWYNTSHSQYQNNLADTPYYYFAIG